MKKQWPCCLLMLFSYPLSLLFSFLLGLLEYGILRLFEHILSDNMTWQAIAQSHFVVSLSEGTVFFFISLNLIAVLWLLQRWKA